MISTSIYNLEGEKTGKVVLPQEIFGAKINPALMAQAVKVYLSNQRNAWAKAKTRGEVDRTKAKAYRQKGTGRARHGSRSAPIFVGGGKAHGPTGEQNYEKTLPQKMRRASLLSALTAKLCAGKIIVVESLEKVSGKTKKASESLKKLGLRGKKTKLVKKEKILVVLPKKAENLIFSFRNLPEVKISLVSGLNTYLILRSDLVLLTKESIKALKEKYGAS